MIAVRRLVVTSVTRTQRTKLKALLGSLRYTSTIELPPREKSGPEYVPFSIPDGQMGQPTYHTHPHLISKGDLTCGITQQEYLERRNNFVTSLVEQLPYAQNANHIIVIAGAVKQYMSDKIPYPFRQNSDFYYLTGCLEPNSVLVLLKPSTRSSYKSTLFVNEKNSHDELWEGPRTGTEAATHLFAVNESRPIENFAQYFTNLVQTTSGVLWFNKDCSANPLVNSAIRDTLRQTSEVALANPQDALHNMRIIKSPAEVELMRHTCLIGCQALNMAMSCTVPGMSEHTLGGVLEFTCRQAGAEQLAFPPVIAGGSRATHIHYVINNQILKEDEMLLVDSGTQRWLYNSDISRTWPVNGKFSKYHKVLYELVLFVQKRLIKLLGEHRLPLDQLFDQMCRLLGHQLQQEGILPKTLKGNELLSRVYRLCPHHVSHYLGLDVHDSNTIRRNIPVQTNMIVTVEPGLYIRQDDKTVPEEFRGIGVRIEDDILITDDGVEVLTENCVKEVDQIEKLVGKHHATVTPPI